MSNDVTTSDGGAPMTPPTSRRRALWVATGVAGLTGVVGLAALGGLAARDNDKSNDQQRVAENRAAAPQNVGDAGKADDKKDGDKGEGRDADAQNAEDEYGRDGKDRDKDRDRDSDRDHGKVREVPCDEEKLIEAVDLANRDHGGTLKLAPHCTYELSFADKKSGTGLPTIKQEITIKGNDATIKRDSEDAFRIFRVADGGDLTLKDLTVKDGNAAEFKYGRPSVPGGPQIPGGPYAPQAGAGATAPTAAPAPPPPPGKDGKEGEGDGGALLVEHGGSAHLKKVELTHNNAENDGGAIANFGRVEVEWSTLDNNHAQKNGGAIFNVGTLKVIGSKIADNTAGENGGGIANGRGAKGMMLVRGRDDAGTVEIVKSAIVGNTAGENGGGVFSSGGFVKIAFSVIKGNTACKSGGGIYARNTDLDLEKVIVAKNHADKDGGGIVNTGGEKKKDTPSVDGRERDQDATATITDSAIVDNTAGHFGGGIFNGEEGLYKVEDGYQEWVEGNGDNARLTLRDTEIKGNTAENGGGIFNNEGTVTLTKTHVTKNTATDSSKNHRVAGGILNHKGKVRLDDESTVTNNDPTNCAGTVKDCFN